MNLFEDHSSHYDILELTADATPQEIRSAYLRLKSAYSKDNIAHYTLFSREETESMLQKIESAYIILSNPEKRRSYDEAQGLSSSGMSMGATTMAQHAHSVNLQNSQGSAFTPNDFAASGYGLNSTESVFDPSPRATTAYAPMQQSSHPTIDLDAMIQIENEWSGAFIRKVREAKRMSLEDLSDYTRISRIYLNAIEEEDFKKLPAAVYVRGFLQQVAKRLKLPVEVLVQKYLERYKSVIK